MNYSTPGFSVLHYLLNLLKLMSIELIMPSNHSILCRPFHLLPWIFLSNRVFFQRVGFLHQVVKVFKALASASVFPMNIQDWLPLGLTGLISLQSKGLSRVFSNTTVQKHQFFSAQLSYSPTLTSIHDYQKNHSFDYIDLCWQSNIPAFFHTLSRFVITFPPRSKHLLIL